MKLLSLIFSLCLSTAVASDIPAAIDLEDDGRQASDTSSPVVVLFTATYCAYCTAVKTEFFQHLMTDSRYTNKVILREVVIDSAQSMTGFSGKANSHQQFASQNGVYLVPTVRFFNGQGEQLAESMVGVVTMDYYGWYLDQRIQQSMKQMLSSHRDKDSVSNPG